MAVEGYRGKVFFARISPHQFFVIDVYSGKWIVYLGRTALGNSVTAGSVAFYNVYGVSIDCVRKSIFVAEYGGNIVKEVKLGTLVTTHVAGVYTVGIYNGHGGHKLSDQSSHTGPHLPR